MPANGKRAEVSVRDYAKPKSSPVQCQKPGDPRAEEVSRENPSRGQKNSPSSITGKIQAVRPKTKLSRADREKGKNQKHMGKKLRRIPQNSTLTLTAWVTHNDTG